MNLFNQLRITLFAQLSALLFSTSSFSTIYFDHEADPIPIVEINVVIPVGALDEKEKNLGVTQVIPEYLDAGTKSLNRIAFHQKLSDYAAELSFGTGEHYSSWTLRFPYVEGKNYDSLIKILRENWNHPRYSQASFDLAIKKVNASFVSSLNSDQNLARTYLDYWIDKNIFGLSNLYIDDLNNISYAESRSFFEEKFLKVKDIWAGVVAPKQSFPLVKSILSTVFSKQGDIEMGMLKEELRERNFLVKKNGVKKFFIIEKSQRAQNVLALKSINNKKMSGSMELPYFVANNVLFGGRDSIFFNEIRNRRGLAYYIHSLERRINHYPVISFVSNPQANLIDSALKVVSDQLALIFKKQESLKKMNQEEWNAQFDSYKNAAILNMSTPGGRLGRRKAIVLGIFSYEYWKTAPWEWKVDQNDSQKALNRAWTVSNSQLYSIVGDSKKLIPVIKKYYPKFSVQVIPYNKVIHSSAYN